MKQTAVEWLVKQISSSKYFYNLMEELESRSTIVQPNGILQQAKAMEKEQIIDAYKDGRFSGQDNWGYGNDTTPQQYYNETFNNK
jgi:HEPN domain-containing protein